MEHILHTAQLRSQAKNLKIGDRVILSGPVYTARDAAHKRMFEQMNAGKPLPFALQDAVIYYAGPTPAKPGMAVGSCGPTTSGRMDPYAPRLLDLGLVGMIGKGERSQPVVEAIRRNRAVYLCAIGGAGALACQHITACTVLDYEDLGCESVKRLEFDRFPLIVAIDSEGSNIFESPSRKLAE